MPHPRAPYHHGDLRNALVTSAVRLIEEGGPGAFSLREAARDVGVSANAAYRHFVDKAALMGAAAADGHARLARAMRQGMDQAAAQATDARPSIARFKAAGRAYVGFATEHPALFSLMFGEEGAACERHEAADPSDETPWTLLGAALDALVADGLLAPERRAGAEMKAWVVVHGLASLTLARLTEGTEDPEALESLLDFTVMGLCGEVRAGREEGRPRGRNEETASPGKRVRRKPERS